MAVDANALTKNDLEKLLRPKLDAEDAQIDDFSITRLTKPGDNIGSTMLAVDVTLKPGRRALYLVAKMLPKSTAIKEMFQCDVTVRKETDCYQLVCPAYERLQKENNVPEDKYLNVFPVCYGARISSEDDSGPVDDGSVILQENLKVQGYECVDRLKGLDMTHCKFVLDKLARFHATAVAMKIKKPEEFRDTVLRAARTVVISPSKYSVLKLLETIPEYEIMKDRINTALSKSKEMFETENPKPPREPFATLTHLDLWVNNLMFHYGPDSYKENPKDLKIVDYQITRYDSPGRDLLFFLYTCAKLEVLSEQYDYLVRWYYDNFVDCLLILECDTAPFTFEEFLREIEMSSVIELWHILFMTVAISKQPDSFMNTDEFKHENWGEPLKVGPSFFRRASKIIFDFALRNWI